MSSNTASPQDPVTLDNCEREPIRVPGSIQPHGTLLAFNPSTGAVLFSADNFNAFLRLPGLPVQDRSLADVLGAAPAEAILGGIRRSTLGGITSQFSLRLEFAHLPGDPFDATVHVHRGVGMVELERVADPAQDWIPVFADAMHRMQDSESVEELLSLLAGRIKRMTGLDQIMVYRFDESWNGQVVAERCEPDMQPFLGLHFPASDIPAQARELYLSNLVRHIADVHYVPVPVRPTIDRATGQPLDMSQAQLRSASPMHLQYLKNMGVGSTLVMSIVVQGRLWGLISCHHRKPCRIPQPLRHACRLVVLSLGYMLAALQQQLSDRKRQSLAALQVRILKTFNTPHADLPDIVEGISTDLLRLAGASSGALWHRGQWVPFGQPLPGLAPWLADFAKASLGRSAGAPVFWNRPPPADEAQFQGSGILGLAAISLDPFAESGLLWLRPEWIREVYWGGNPDKAMNLALDANGQPLLSPRNSFAKFLTIAKGEAMPWDQDTQQALAGLASLQESLVVRDSLSKLSQSDQRFRSLVALQSDSYWQCDLQGRIMAFSRDLGFGSSEIGGRPLASLYAGRARQEDVDALVRCLEGFDAFRDLAVSAHEGTDAGFFAHQVSGEPIRDDQGVIVGMHGTISDITERRLEEIRRQEAERQALSASQAKGSFLAMMSHEIRTPLNGVMGNLALLRDLPLPPQAERLVRSASSASGVLHRVINDVLDLSRIEAGMLEIAPRPAMLAEVHSEVIALTAADADLKGLRLAADISGTLPPWVLVDDLRLRQILLNLLGNAVKFTERGEVRLVVHGELSGTDRVHLSYQVQDTGIGMTEEQLKRVLEPFQQGSVGITRRYGGSGLGLSIAQRLLGLMGSAGLSISSSAGQGSVFAFGIDCECVVGEADPGAQESQGEPLAAIPEGLHVLLVDDSAGNLQVAASMLERLGAEVRVATHGADALEALASLDGRVDLILMDLQMPVMDGLSATRAIRARPEWAAIPIVALTANAYEADRESCLAAGMNGFLAKPYDLRQFARALASVSGGGGSARE